MIRRCSAVLAAALLLPLRWTLPSANAVCISNLNDIVFPEIELAQSGGDTSTERIYVLCPNTNFVVGNALNASDPLNYTGGSFPLVLVNPHMTVFCGDDGMSSNNCTVQGGANQVIALQHDTMPLDWSDIYPDISDFNLSGVVFQGATRLAFSINSVGTNVRINDCTFEDQKTGDFVMYLDSPKKAFPVQRRRDEKALTTPTVGQNADISVSVTKCTFRNNQVALSVVATIGAVYTHLRSSTFNNNTIPESDNGLGSLLWFTDGSGTIVNNCFIQNLYAFSNTLVNGGIFEFFDNYATDKPRYQTIGCDDTAFVKKDDTLADAIFNELYICGGYNTTNECLANKVATATTSAAWSITRASTWCVLIVMSRLTTV